MAKEVTGFIKLQIKGGAANPAPPVGPALGSKGLNIMDFCKQFNARTQDQAGKVLPVVITVYSDKSFSFEVKQPPVAVSLKEAAKISKASGEPNRKKVHRTGERCFHLLLRPDHRGHCHRQARSRSGCRGCCRSGCSGRRHVLIVPWKRFGAPVIPQGPRF